MKFEESKYNWNEMAKFVSGELSESQKEDFLAESKEIDDCELLSLVEKDMSVVDRVNNKKTEKVNEAWKNLYNRLEQDDLLPEKEVKTIQFGMIYKAVAAVIIAVSLTFAGIQLINDGVVGNKYIAVSNSNKTNISLPDGSLISLNGNSKVIYPKNFNGKERRVRLKGEAFFDVKRNPDVPFIIEAGKAEIKVLGTSFNVLAENKKSVEVLVESGLVQLSPKGIEDKAILLSRGEFGILENNVASKKIVENDNYMSWKTREIVFRQTDLETVVNILNRTYSKNIDLRIDNPSKFKLDGTYENDDFDTILQAICITFDLKASKLKNKIVLEAN